MFNWDPNKHLTVNEIGSDVGLKVTLNLEQYEYMPGMITVYNGAQPDHTR